MIKLSETVWVSEHEIEERFVRASGPGGQHVNKVATAVELRYDPFAIIDLNRDRAKRVISSWLPGICLAESPSNEYPLRFVVIGDRTGGPPEGIEILRQAVADVNLFEPDLVTRIGAVIVDQRQALELDVRDRERRRGGAGAAPAAPAASREGGDSDEHSGG